MKIDELEFSARTHNCLKRVGIDTVEKLLTMSDTDLMKIRCFGVKCLAEVHEKIRKPYGVATITPAIPGPSESDPNIMELCFRNGENHMRDKIKHNLQFISKDMPCVPISLVIKILEDL